MQILLQIYTKYTYINLLLDIQGIVVVFHSCESDVVCIDKAQRKGSLVLRNAKDNVHNRIIGKLLFER